MPETIDDYIAKFPEKLQSQLQQVRNAIRRAAPQAEEAIKYQMPTFVQNGNLVHFAAWKNHIGFYAVPHCEPLQDQIARYAGPKGSLKFPLDEPLPLALISKLVKIRVRENLAKPTLKQLKKARRNPA